MTNKQIIHEFHIAITEAKGADRKTIRIADLENFLQLIESEIDANGEITENNFQSRLAEFSAENERNLAQYNAKADSSLELFRSVINAGQTATRNMIIINGGACIAILAFVGGLFEKNETLARSLSIALLYFGLGVLSGGFVAGFTYLSQTAYNEGKDKYGNWIRVICIILGLVSYALFALGSYQTYCLIK